MDTVTRITSTAELLTAYAAGRRDFRRADLGGADLGGANLGGANLGEANLREANLREAYLGEAYLGEADLGEADLGEADLGEAYLGEAYLGEAYLGGADLGGADLGGANLRGANLREANLREAYLGEANLGEADLGGANLREADLGGANLREANLGGADLGGANLAEVRLAEANLREANLQPVRDDLLAFCALVPAEVPGLLAALEGGNVDGSCYSGACACLVGTVANLRHVEYVQLPELVPGLTIERWSLRERWFLAIGRDDTPANNPVAAITAGWLREWLAEREQAQASGAAPVVCISGDCQRDAEDSSLYCAEHRSEYE